jgi:hypothetical protein
MQQVARGVREWARGWTVDASQVDPGALGVAGLLIAFTLSGVVYSASVQSVLMRGKQYMLSYLAYTVLFMAMVTFPVLMRLPLSSNRILPARRFLFVVHIAVVVLLSVFFSLVVFSELFTQPSPGEMMLMSLGNGVALFPTLLIEAVLALPAIRRRLLYQPRGLSWLNVVAALAAFAGQIVLAAPNLHDLASIAWNDLIPVFTIEVSLTAFFGLLMQDMYCRYSVSFVTVVFAQVVLGTAVVVLVFLGQVALGWNSYFPAGLDGLRVVAANFVSGMYCISFGQNVSPNDQCADFSSAVVKNMVLNMLYFFLYFMTVRTVSVVVPLLVTICVIPLSVVFLSFIEDDLELDWATLTPAVVLSTFALVCSLLGALSVRRSSLVRTSRQEFLQHHPEMSSSQDDCYLVAGREIPEDSDSMNEEGASRHEEGDIRLSSGLRGLDNYVVHHSLDIDSLNLGDGYRDTVGTGLLLSSGAQESPPVWQRWLPFRSAQTPMRNSLRLLGSKFSYQFLTQGFWILAIFVTVLGLIGIFQFSEVGLGAHESGICGAWVDEQMCNDSGASCGWCASLNHCVMLDCSLLETSPFCEDRGSVEAMCDEHNNLDRFAGGFGAGLTACLVAYLPILVVSLFPKSNNLVVRDCRRAGWLAAIAVNLGMFVLWFLQFVLATMVDVNVAKASLLGGGVLAFEYFHALEEYEHFFSPGPGRSSPRVFTRIALYLLVSVCSGVVFSGIQGLQAFEIAKATVAALVLDVASQLITFRRVTVQLLLTVVLLALGVTNLVFFIVRDVEVAEQLHLWMSACLIILFLVQSKVILGGGENSEHEREKHM